MTLSVLTTRRLVLLVALSGSLAAALAISDRNADAGLAVSAPAEKVRKAPQAAKGEPRQAPDATGGAEALLELAPRQFKVGASGLFKVEAPRAKEARRSEPLPEATPAAPPLPFRYLGRMDTGDKVAALLSYQGKEITVKAGDRVDEKYRVDEGSAIRVRLTYLPLNEPQTLNIRETN